MCNNDESVVETVDICTPFTTVPTLELDADANVYHTDVNEDNNTTKDQEKKVNKKKIREPSSTITTCGSCHHEAIKGKNSLKCSTCLKLSHYECTRLPPYMLYIFNSTKKQFTCEECASTPEEFLRSIINKSIDSTLDIKNIRVNESIELKINDIYDYIEKFNLYNIVQNLNNVNSRIIENISKLEKKIIDSEKVSLEINTASTITDELLQARIDELMNEIQALKASQKLLMESLDEKDKKIMILYEGKEKRLNCINEKHKMIQNLEIENRELLAFRDDDTIKENDLLKGENEAQKQYLRESEAKYFSSLELIDALKRQIKEYSNRVDNLKGDLETLREEKADLQTRITVLDQTPLQTPTPFDSSPQHKVILMHDSMCGKINNTLCSKENVKVEKVWDPHVAKVQEEIENLGDDIDVIVIHTITNALCDKTVEELINDMSQVVDRGLVKTKKIIISTIINRDDDQTLSAKAAVINANLRLKFMNNPRVIISSNDNLNEKKQTR